jgi:hypothetical protein
MTEAAPWSARLVTWWRGLVLSCQRGLLAVLIFPVRSALLELMDARVRFVVQMIEDEREQREGPARRAAQAQLAERVRLARQGRVGAFH